MRFLCFFKRTCFRRTSSR